MYERVQFSDPELSDFLLKYMTEKEELDSLQMKILLDSIDELNKTVAGLKKDSGLDPLVDKSEKKDDETSKIAALDVIIQNHRVAIQEGKGSDMIFSELKSAVRAKNAILATLGKAEEVAMNEVELEKLRLNVKLSSLALVQNFHSDEAEIEWKKNIENIGLQIAYLATLFENMKKDFEIKNEQSQATKPEEEMAVEEEPIEVKSDALD